MAYGNWYHLGLSLLTLFVVIVTTTIHLLAWFPTDVTKDMLPTPRPSTLLVRGEPLVSSVWVRWLWVGLYAYQLGMCVYAALTFCRPYTIQRPLRQAVHPLVLMTYALGLLFSLAWLFLSDYSGAGHPQFFSGLALLGAAVTVHVAYSIALGTIRNAKSTLMAQSPCEVVMMRVMVYNCLAAHGAWLLISVFLEVARVVGSYTDLQQETIQFLWLGFVTGYVFIFFLLEIVCSTSALEYTLTPYLVALVILGSVFTNVDDIIADAMTTPAPEDPEDGKVENVAEFVTIAVMCLIGLLMFIAMGVAIRKNQRSQTDDPDSVPLKKVDNLASDVIRVNNLVSYETEPKKYFDKKESFSYK